MLKFRFLLFLIAAIFVGSCAERPGINRPSSVVNTFPLEEKKRLERRKYYSGRQRQQLEIQMDGDTTAYHLCKIKTYKLYNASNIEKIKQFVDNECGAFMNFKSLLMIHLTKLKQGGVPSYVNKLDGPFGLVHYWDDYDLRYALRFATDGDGCFKKGPAFKNIKTFLEKNDKRESIQCEPKHIMHGCFRNLTQKEEHRLKNKYKVTKICNADIGNDDLKKIVYDSDGCFKNDYDSGTINRSYRRLADHRKIQETDRCKKLRIERAKMEEKRRVIEEERRIAKERERKRIAKKEEKRRLKELKIKKQKQEKIRRETIKSTSAKMFLKERKTCATLGFKVGTPRHAECVLKLMEQ